MHVLAILPGLIPSTIIGIVKPLERLSLTKEISFRVKTTRLAKREDVRGADVVVFCRNCDYADLEFLYEAKRAGKYVVYDIDDNFFEISTHSALGMMHKWSPRLFIITEFFRLADVVRTYAKPVYDEAKKYNDNVLLVRSYFDFSLIDGVQRPARLGHSEIRICYQTSRGPHDTMMPLFLQPLNRVIFEAPGEIEFHFWGKEYPPINDRKAVKLHPFQSNYDKFVVDCYRAQFDIGLAPAGTDIFSQSKTNNKYREYGAMGVAGVYTRMPVYEDCVEDGVTGLLVDNTESAWRDAIERLVKDAGLRQRIIDNAREDVRRNYSIESAVEGWREILRETDNPRYGSVPPEPQERKMNVLALVEEGRDLTPWLGSVSEVCGFMRAVLDVHPLENINEMYRKPYDAVIVLASAANTLAQAAWKIQHRPKRLFLVLAHGSPIVVAPEIDAVDATEAKLQREAVVAEGRAESALDEICALMGHVTVVTNDPHVATVMKTPTRLFKDPSPINDIKGEGLARFWIEAFSQTPIRRRESGLELRINHRLAGLRERQALLQINLRGGFRSRR